jgi:hypothetical protein
MKSTPRELVQAAIRRKIAKAKKVNDTSAETPKEVCIQFLRDFDDEISKTKSAVARYFLIEEKPDVLIKRLMKFDPAVTVELVWHGDEVEDLRLEGIRAKIRGETLVVSVVDLIFEV